MSTISKVGNFINREVKNYCQEKAKEKRREERREEKEKNRR